MLLKILTLGLLGRSKVQQPARCVNWSFRPPKFNRPSEKATEKVVRKYFPEEEVEYVMSRIGDNRSDLYFDSLHSQATFLTDLQRAGWGEFTTNSLSDCSEDFLYFQEGVWRWASDLYVEPKAGRLVPRRNVDWNSDDQLIDTETGQLVTRLSDVSYKEANKYVTKSQKAA